MSERVRPVEARMLAVLADGLPHPREELRACLADDLGTYKNILCHLTAIRKRLRPKGEDIICQLLNNRLTYRHIRLLRHPGE